MQQRGFTLVEAMTTVTIIALMLMMGLPSMSDFMRNQRVRTTAESIQTGLQQARNEAVRRNISVSFWLVSTSDSNAMDNSCALSATSGGWVVSVSDPTGLCATAASATATPMIVSTQAAGNVAGTVAIAAKQSDAATDATAVTFNGFGQVSNSTSIARVLVTTASDPTAHRRLRIDVSTGGLLHVCDLGVTDSTDPRYCAP